MRAKIVLLAAALFFILGSFGLSAQEKYRIADIVFHIKGITRESALRRNAEIQVGHEFVSLEELKAYLADRQQVIINFRMIDSAEVTYEEKGLDNGVTLVEVHVKTKDSWSLIAVPYFTYDSNNGLKLLIKARDYNFLGTMETLRINLSYYESSEEFTLSVLTALNFPWLGLTWTLTPSQDIDVLGNDPNDDFYLMTGLDLGSYLDTPWKLGAYPLRYTFGVLSNIKYTLNPDRPISEYRKGLVIGFRNGLSNGRIDWRGNFRNGYSLVLDNTNKYNLYSQSWLPWDRELSAAAILHRALNPPMEMYPRSLPA